MLGDAPMPSDVRGHKRVKRVIPLHARGPQTRPQTRRVYYLPKAFNYFYLFKRIGSELVHDVLKH